MLSSVNVAIPTIAQALGADAVLASWFASAYLLASAVFLLPFGKLADMYGRKRVFQIGMAAIALTSLAAATAPSAPVLVAYRLLQGVGAAMLFATGVAILSSVYPREQRGRVIGLTVSAVYLGLTVGPMIGGFVTEHLGWRAVLAWHVPLPLAAIALVRLRLPGEWAGPPGQRFDLPGALLYGAAICAFMYGVSHLPAPAGVALVAAGCAGLAAFLRFERGRAHPLFDVSLLATNRVFTYSCSAALAMYAATFANSFLMSLYLQHLKGMSAAAAGLVMMAQPLVQTVGSPFAGRLSDRVEPRVIASIGMAVTALGLAALAALDAGSPLAAVIAALVLVGAGFALFSSPNVNAIMGSVEPRHYGTASGTVATVRVLGQMLSMAVATLVIAVIMGRVPVAPAHYDALGRALSTSFLAAAVLCAAGIFFSLARGPVRAGAARETMERGGRTSDREEGG